MGWWGGGRLPWTRKPRPRDWEGMCLRGWGGEGKIPETRILCGDSTLGLPASHLGSTKNTLCVFLLFLSLGLFQGGNYKETSLPSFQRQHVLARLSSGLPFLEVKRGAWRESHRVLGARGPNEACWQNPRPENLTQGSFLPAESNTHGQKGSLVG